MRLIVVIDHMNLMDHAQKKEELPSHSDMQGKMAFGINTINIPPLLEGKLGQRSKN